MTSTPTSPANPSSATSAPAQPSGWYYAFLITYLVLMSAFGSFVNDMYIPSLPEMVRSFHTNTSTVQLGLTFGMLGLALGELFLGPLSDKYGRKPTLILALVIFCIGAVCSIWSKTIHEFIWWRLVQGVGASGGYFLARTIPADLYKGRALAKVMALVGAINGFAPASAPMLGGLMAKAVGWRGIFWALAGFSSLLLLLWPVFRESLPKSRRKSVKLSGAFGNYIILAKNPKFVAYTLLKGTALGILFAYIASAPFIIQNHYGYTQLQFGLFMGFNALFVACGSEIQPPDKECEIRRHSSHRSRGSAVRMLLSRRQYLGIRSPQPSDAPLSGDDVHHRQHPLDGPGAQLRRRRLRSGRNNRLHLRSGGKSAGRPGRHLPLHSHNPTGPRPAGPRQHPPEREAHQVTPGSLSPGLLAKEGAELRVPH